jgi:sigma-B regulation protein RsbU (phosphoserine phosphatase)
MVSSANQERYHFNQNLLGWMHLNKKPLVLNNPREDNRFQGVRWDDSITSLVCVPMMVKSELMGVLTLYNKKGGTGFTEDDQRLLAIIGAQSAQVVENARLYESEQALFHMREELRLASKIQNDLLPKTFPEIPGYDLAGKSVPAQMVGGDYFDFIPIETHRLAVCLGDVSGKGLPASLLMANLQATLRGQTLLNASAKECVRRSNKLLHLSTSSEKFVTLFYGILDIKDHSLCFSNAGHENPLLISGGKEPLRLNTGGIVLSIMEEFPYEEETVPLLPGDLLVIYSDGVTDAINTRQELWGEARLTAVVKEHRDAGASALIDHIIAAVQSHAGEAPQMDDITLVVIKRKDQ